MENELQIVPDRICNKCSISKPVGEFNKLKNGPGGLDRLCKQCTSEYGKRYRKENPQMYEKMRQRHKEFMKGYSHVAWERDKLNPEKMEAKTSQFNKWRATLRGKFVCWRKSAKKRQIDWDLNFEDVQNVPLVCHYTGEVLTLETHCNNTISLDRIDNSKGYTKDNVVFCGKLVNNMKNTQAIEVFRDVCRKVAAHMV